MARRQKLGTPQGVGQWKALETAADVRRFLRWCILSVRDQSLDPRTAAIFGQLGCYLLKALEGSDFEKRLGDIERMVEQQAAGNGGNNGTARPGA